MLAWFQSWPPLSTVADYTELVGFLVTVVAFVVGIYKLKEIREEAERGRTTMRETLERVGQRLLLSNVSTASRLAQELRGLARDRNWNRAIDRGDQLRSLLASASEDAALTNDDRQAVAAAIDDIGLIVRLCERGMDAAEPYSLPTKTTKRPSADMSRVRKLSTQPAGT